LITQPAIILLDEPFSGVDPIAVQDLQREIRHLRETFGISFLLTDHNVRQTLEVTDRSYIIHEGRVIAEGAPRDLINDQVVREAYLGSTFRGDEFDRQHVAPPARPLSGLAPAPSLRSPLNRHGSRREAPTRLSGPHFESLMPDRSSRTTSPGSVSSSNQPGSSNGFVHSW